MNPYPGIQNHTTHCFYVNVLHADDFAAILVADQNSPLKALTDRLWEYSNNNVYLLLDFMLEISTKHITFPCTFEDKKVTCHKFRISTEVADQNIEILLEQIIPSLENNILNDTK